MASLDPALPLPTTPEGESAYSKRLKVAAYLSFPALFVMSTLAAIPLVMLAVVRGSDPTTIGVSAALALTVVAELLVVAAALAWGGQWKHAREVLGLKNFSWKTTLAGAGVGLFFIVGLQLLGMLLTALGSGVESSDTSVSIAAVAGVERYLVLLLLVPLVVPLVEELFFRGYVLGFLLKGHGVGDRPLSTPLGKWALVFTSLVFAAAHFQGAGSLSDLFVVAWIFLFAVVIGVVRVRTASLYPCYAAHLVYNLSTSLLIFFAMGG